MNRKAIPDWWVEFLEVFPRLQNIYATARAINLNPNKVYARIYRRPDLSASLTALKAKLAKEAETGWHNLFLQSLKIDANIRLACEAAGISRTAAYFQYKHNPVFKDHWDEAVEEACDRLEEIARRRAVSMSDTLLIFLLKAHRPHKYRETSPIQMSVPAAQQIVLVKVNGREMSLADYVGTFENAPTLVEKEDPSLSLEAKE